MASAAPETLPKGKFAELCGVTAGRVSQWIAAGKIKPDSLQGEGRTAKVIVARAQADLRDTLDISQRLGNGLGTRLTEETNPPLGAPIPKQTTTEDLLKREKLEQQRFQNRRLREEERARAGVYMRTDEAREGMTRVAAMTLKIFEGGLADLANQLSGQFGLPQRDVLHALRGGFRDVRAGAEKALAQQLEGLPQFVEDDDGIIDDGDSTGEPAEGGP